MARPRLTPHQREVFTRYQSAIIRTGGPVLVERLGSRGAVAHLEHKGYLTTENRPGPRGGQHLYADLPGPGLCFHHEHCGITEKQRCPASPYRKVG